jgi:hypothetical protein
MALVDRDGQDEEDVVALAAHRRMRPHRDRDERVASGSTIGARVPFPRSRSV